MHSFVASKEGMVLGLCVSSYFGLESNFCKKGMHQRGHPCTACYFLDQVPPEESPSTPLPNSLISPLP